MDQLTIRRVPPNVERVILQAKKLNNQSLNKAALSILSIGAETWSNNLSKKSEPLNDFSAFCGIWTKEEADEFDAVIEEMCEQIDEDMWK